jgi:hypothetical protein
MRKFASVALAAAVAASALPAAAQTARKPALPTVLRGTAAHEPEAPPPQPSRLYVVGGTTLWLLDDAGNVLGCALRGSGYVGQNVIYCTKGVLSR